MGDKSLSQFKAFYSDLATPRYRDLLFNSKTAEADLNAIMPFVMGMGKETYSCQGILHPGITCRAFLFKKLSSTAKHAWKICILPAIMPLLTHKRDEFIKTSNSGRLKILFEIFKKYMRNMIWLTIGNAIYICL